ncbi:4-(cytidine 5'-diphospho)-2-C-methyl-D-erythritol kinase [Sphingomonas nostoxanthinifaciens]|uniref:4-(cytidine 5'-diphospho)-2-C-methyl-D-erythritol kinase n=1 Tax=Sphingomonas nostoxanthinifaciens TaxID=2872652 RepID=UPI001CC208DD|nr:4-(cytidine 5'-diphospho)-2-C-methyl-D-erythritol kinase [Sphingomonas nostoxanthinifaciens]UAK26205.1 4-(cytidine 5'-diphospho)-2-C-methyl-D-erythritol kinase [Sphingomonas nostoxanthinifaciens]
MTGAPEVAHAKLNLALHVRRREADGYHAIETLFVFCADGDVLTRTEGPGLIVSGPFAGALGEGGDNLVTRAARGFAEIFGDEEAGFHLDKRLPVAAGIGGGSADAAAALRLLARAQGVAATDPRLMTLAASLGADVPACLLSQPTRGDGRGDRLQPIASTLAGMPVLLVNPRLPLATGPVFAAWDGVDRGPLADGDPLDVARAARNDLEPPARTLLPAIDAVLDALHACAGVTLARMSGSGATCFALFEDAAARDAADAAIGKAATGWWRLATHLL